METDPHNHNPQVSHPSDTPIVTFGGYPSSIPLSLFLVQIHLPSQTVIKKKTRRRGRRGGRLKHKSRHTTSGQVAETIKIYNLASQNLNDQETLLLARGLNFVPTTFPNSFTMFKDFNKFICNLTLKRHYNMKANKTSIQDFSDDQYCPLDTPADRQAIQDLCELWNADEDDDLIAWSQYSHSSPSVHTTFRPNSVRRSLCSHFLSGNF